MKSIRELYRIGNGPSSSHTMGPKKAAERFIGEVKQSIKKVKVTLHGSLAATGKGHMTDKAVESALAPLNIEPEIIWKPEDVLPEHPNGLTFQAYSNEGNLIVEKRYYSIGGGAIKEEGKGIDSPEVYPQKTMGEIIKYVEKENLLLWQYVELYEGKEIWEYIRNVWHAMQDAIQRGLDTEGVLPGGLNLGRKSHSYYMKTRRQNTVFQRTGLLASYALAVSEENASCGEIVTAPTCGACAVLPAVLKYLEGFMDIPEKDILHALATAGIIGNLAKHNASISGAEAGCQAEVGVGCAMAAAAAAEIMGGSILQVEYAAEMGLEHHLGLTCDPIDGLVQIPCIERNAVAATRAMDCADFALLSDGKHRVSYDEVVETMRQTGLDLKSSYRETSQGGLAKIYKMKVDA